MSRAAVLGHDSQLVYDQRRSWREQADQAAEVQEQKAVSTWHDALRLKQQHQVAQPYSTAGLSTEDVQYNDASRPSNSPGKDDAQHSRLLLGQSVRQLPADAFVQSKKDLAGSTHRQPTQDLLQETDADYDTSYIEGSNFGGFESDLEEDQMEGHTRSQKDSASPASAPVRDELVVELFEQRSMLLSAIMESTACRAQSLVQRVLAAEAEAASSASRLAGSEAAAAAMRGELHAAHARMRGLETEVSRLGSALDVHKQQAAYSQGRLQDALSEARGRCAALRALGQQAASQRDDALSALVHARGEVEGMQSCLADSAVYVRYLRRRVLELELAAAASQAAAAAAEQARSAASEAAAAAAGRGGGDDSACTSGGAAFSMAAVRASVHAAVADARACGDVGERKRRIRALQLRWHPDKNPVLTELSSEVSKLINEALAAMAMEEASQRQGQGQGPAAHGPAAHGPAGGAAAQEGGSRGGQSGEGGERTAAAD